MSTKEDGGPAFPVVAENGLGHIASGVTVRDYFAAQAIAGGLAHMGNHERAAEFAYSIADAMLAERSK